MKALTASALATVMIAMAAQPTLADDDHRIVSKKTLVEFCKTVPADSRTVTTLTGRDGKKVTGQVHCETDYEFRIHDYKRSADDSHRGRGDDDRWDDDWDDRWDD